MLSRAPWAWALSALCAGTAVAGCTPPQEAAAPAAPAPGSTPPPDAATRRVSFAWTDLKGRAVDSASMLGRTTVIAFIATYDVASQAEARFLTSISRRHVPRLNVAIVVLEQKTNAPMVEAFVDTLGITYPVAFADEATLAGHGPFEGLHHVPSVVVLDREGHERARHLGFLDEQQLDALIKEAEAAARP